MRFTMPLPRQRGARKASDWLRRIAGECAAWIIVVVVALVTLAPVALFLAAGAWGVSLYIGTLLTLWRHVQSYQLGDLAPLLDVLDRAGRVALASAGYFALLCALIVLMAGLLGKRWRRLFLFPGIVFTVPSALAFFFGLRLSLDDLGEPYHLSSPAQTALMAYLLLDAIVLAAALVDVSPRRRFVQHVRPLAATAPLVPIHFGPSGPRATRSREQDTARASATEARATNVVEAVTDGAPAMQPATESARAASLDQDAGNGSGASSPVAQVS